MYCRKIVKKSHFLIRVGILMLLVVGWLGGPLRLEVRAASASPKDLPLPYQSVDIGSVGQPGSATESGGTFTVSGSGTDIWGSSDQFQYVYQTLTGDGQIVARVASQSSTNGWAKAGVMFRESLSANAAYGLMAVAPGFGVAFQWRAATSGTSINHTLTPGTAAPYYVKLVKLGSSLIGYVSSDGITYTQVGSAAVVMANANLYVGLAVTAHDNSATSTATFDNVSFNTTASASGSLPSGYQAQDIGSVGIAGNSTYDSNSSTFTVSASGGDIWDVSDQFRYTYEAWSGDGQIIAHVLSVENTGGGWAKAGVMIRETLNADSAQGMMLLSPNNGGVFQSRGATASSTKSSSSQAVLAPYWLKLVRIGDILTGYVSSDGSVYTQAGVATVPMATNVYMGLALTAHDNSQLNTSTFDHVNISTVTVTATPTPSPTPTPVVGILPTGSLSQDIGGATTAGSASYDSGTGTYTISGTGNDIWGSSDQFHYVYQPWTGDGQVIARVASQQNTGGGWAKSGVMIRETLNPDAAQAMMFVSPSFGVNFQQRTTTGGSTVGTSGPSAAAPYWVKLVRVGNIFTGYASSDGTVYTQVGTATISMASSVYMGLIVTPHNASQVNTSTFDNVSISTVTTTITPTPTSTPTPTPTPTPIVQALPNGNLSQDIGLVGISGSASYNSGTGTYTISGSGNDIWDVSDQFRYVYQPWTGDGEVIARVASQQNTGGGWAKAGVMIRETLNNDAIQANMLLTSGNGAIFQWRDATGGTTKTSAALTASAPYWLKIVRVGNVFTAYASSDGVTYTQVGTSTMTMASSVYMGVAVTSHDDTLLNTSTFDNVSISTVTPTNTPTPVLTPTPTATATPTPVVTVLSNGQLSQDIGAVGVAGSASYNSGTGTYTISGSGTDIWDVSDQFRYVYQPWTGDGQFIARVASQQNTGGGWAKTGIMMRETLANDSAHAMLVLSPDYGANFQWRSAAGNITQTNYGPIVAAPYWLKLTRIGSALTGYVSSDGATYTQIGSATVAMANSVYVGEFVTSHDNALLNTSTIDNVSTSSVVPTVTPTPTPSPTATPTPSPTATPTPSPTATATPSPTATPTPSPTATLPSGIQTQDIGSVGATGAAAYDSGTGAYTISGSGNDIWGTADAFRYVYESLSGDGQIIAHVASQDSPDTWAKSGVMIRETLDPASAYAMTMITPGNGAYFQWRTATGAAADNGTAGSAVTAPYWVKLTRVGDVLTSYTSSDGVTYTQVSSVTITMATNVYIGLAVTSHNAGVLNTSVLDNVSISTVVSILIGGSSLAPLSKDNANDPARPTPVPTPYNTPLGISPMRQTFHL